MNDCPAAAEGHPPAPGSWLCSAPSGMGTGTLGRLPFLPRLILESRRQAGRGEHGATTAATGGVWADRDDRRGLLELLLQSALGREGENSPRDYSQVFPNKRSSLPEQLEVVRAGLGDRARLMSVEERSSPGRK